MPACLFKSDNDLLKQEMFSYKVCCYVLPLVSANYQLDTKQNEKEQFFI